jgi:hypothetical protein
MTSWAFKDGAVVYSFPINPNEHGNLVLSRGIEWQYSRQGYSGTRAGRIPFATSFSGVLRSEAQYDAMLLWLRKRKRINLVTDLNQEFTVRLTAFKPSQEGASRQAPAWRWTYSMELIVLESLPYVAPT